MNVQKYMEWSAAILGLSAATIASFNIGDVWVFTAMCLFMFKDILMAIISKVKDMPGIFWGSIGYMVIDVIGIYRWWPF